MATDRKTVFGNIIIIALQLAYETETLNKNNVRNTFIKKYKTFKKMKKPKDAVLTVSEKSKKYQYKNPSNFSGVCNTTHTLLKTRLFN